MFTMTNYSPTQRASLAQTAERERERESENERESERDRRKRERMGEREG